MAKELPYFQFEPAEYLTGDISFCSLSAQGLFTILCSYYWQRSCKLTKDQFLRRINNQKEFQELIDENVIELKDNAIKIKFLDEQFNKIEEKKQSDSEKGRIGNLKRWHKDVYDRLVRKEISLNEAEKIAKQSPPDKKTNRQKSQIREDKIREDKIREDKIINNANFLIKSLSSSQWIETVCLQNKVKQDVVKLFLNEFNDHLITMEEQKDNTREFKQHFVHWLKKQDLSQFREKVIGKTNQI